MGCHTCQIACKERSDLPVGQRWRRIIELAAGTFEESEGFVRARVSAWYLSMACNHCARPLCVANCPTGALHKRPTDGIVLVDPSRCIGCRYCTWSCPYGAPQFDALQGKVGKCDACADRLARAQQPACVESCPVRALRFGPIEELRSSANHPASRELPSPSLTDPSLVVRPHRDAIDPKQEP
ncbi:MAG: dimethylsulfoxide reductase subunit B [Deltaproteobacteria bacterium]|nr:dimethylsulfoxide reductase subunit B [Deltaproteobacteria bacterium]